MSRTAKAPWRDVMNGEYQGVVLFRTKNVTIVEVHGNPKGRILTNKSGVHAEVLNSGKEPRTVDDFIDGLNHILKTLGFWEKKENE